MPAVKRWTQNEMNTESKLGMSLDDIAKQKTTGIKKDKETKKEARGTKRKSAQTMATKSRRLYVGNLAYKTSWQDLKDHFKTAGTVTYAKTVKGWGIVEMETVEEAEAAIAQLNDVELDGRPLNVREDREDKEVKGGSKGTEERETKPTSKKTKGNDARPVGEVGRRLFVQNLSYGTSWQDLKDHFRQAGNVVHTSILKDGRRSKGCGIVEFETAADAKNAMETLNETELDGRAILIREDREDKEMKRQGSAPRGRANGKGPEGTQLVIHGLPWEFTWQNLKDMLTDEGVEVLRADIVQDRKGRSKGFGTVSVASKEDAEKAIAELDGAELEGRPLSVKFDKYA